MRSGALWMIAGVVVGCASPTAPRLPGPSRTDTTAPPITREMRALWVATVRNIDWPSKSGLSAAQQRAELVDIFDRAAANGFNAIIFQVRPAGDALYSSALEPWAAPLTGTQGADPGYDPLAFAVAEAHARGLELHAWINPFRAGITKDSALLAPTHAFNAHRELVRVYGTQLWSDPGEPEVQEHAIRVVRDIVERYDIDGMHADDYFYPYQENDAAGRLIDFPDSGSYARSGSTMPKDDWRRANIDRFVERMYREVHQVKPEARVGISPFGIWRPGFPSSVSGLDAYATIYADSRKWLQSGWVDYLAPQLYWAISAPKQSFPALLDWWIGENTLGRHIWPGLATYRIGSGATAFGPTEIADQIKLTRLRPGASGHIHFNTTTTLAGNGGANLSTIAPLYVQHAVPPAFSWLGNMHLSQPALAVSGRIIGMSPAAGETVRWWFVRALTATGWTARLVFGAERTFTLEAAPTRVLLTPIDAAGNAGVTVEWRR